MAPLSVFYTNEQIASNIYILSSISNVAVSFPWPLLTSFPADTSMFVSPEPRSHIVFQLQANSLSGRVWKSVSAWALRFCMKSGWRGGPARGNSALCVSCLNANSEQLQEAGLSWKHLSPSSPSCEFICAHIQQHLGNFYEYLCFIECPP